MFANTGNYKGFGDSKFIPNLPVKKFEFLVKNCQAYHNNPALVSALWEKSEKGLYSIYDKVKSLGFPEKVFDCFSQQIGSFTDHDFCRALLLIFLQTIRPKMSKK